MNKLGYSPKILKNHQHYVRHRTVHLNFSKGSFTYYVITKGEGGFRNDYANVIFALSNAEFDYGRGEGV